MGEIVAEALAASRARKGAVVLRAHPMIWLLSNASDRAGWRAWRPGLMCAWWLTRRSAVMAAWWKP